MYRHRLKIADRNVHTFFIVYRKQFLLKVFYTIFNIRTQILSNAFFNPYKTANKWKVTVDVILFDLLIIYIIGTPLASAGSNKGDKNSRILKSMLKIFKLVLFKTPEGSIEVDANFSDVKQ